jgi:hypothetical protein
MMRWIISSDRPLVFALAASLACLGVVFSSSASGYRPTGIYAPFTDCPLSDTAVQNCITSEERRGEFVVGHRTVPINNPLTLQGGLFRSSPGPEGLAFVGAEDGNTLSRTALSFPGGLAGVLAPAYLPALLREQFDASIEGGLTSVTMTPELARPASTIKINEHNLLLEEGVAMQLPLKIKLSNPFLGSDCYIGSPIDPIVLNLTTGATNPPAPNKPIQGTLGLLEGLEGDRVVVMHGNLLVDNSFAVPKATGCGGSYSAMVDTAVDAEIGLPSPAGRNTAILDGTLEKASSTAVRENLE